MNWQELNLQGWVLLAAACLALLVVGLIVWRLLTRVRRPSRSREPQTAVDLSTLPSHGPSPEGPRLEFYGTPVRIAVIAVAPSGRAGELPPPDVLPGLMERLVPGMTETIAQQQPLICRWPAQLSSQGFAQAFFNQIALPGARGKGTPWCSIAGKLTVGQRAFLVGLVLCAAAPNSLSQVVVQHEGQWMDILRMRNE